MEYSKDGGATWTRSRPIEFEVTTMAYMSPMPEEMSRQTLLIASQR